jgi:pimeloyl-ACP methyl ester carboxylesterase/class 3 adenylate cyclase
MGSLSLESNSGRPDHWQHERDPMSRQTRYARVGEISIAYQVVGNGPVDLIYVPSWISNVEENWQEPNYARFLERLASFSRLILFDKRGTGLSDRVVETPTLEQRMEDVRAVMDAVGSERAVLFGSTEGGPMCALFAATYPERTSALVMYGAYAKRIQSPDYPWAPTMEARERFYEQITAEWGGPAVLDHLAPSGQDDRRFCEWWAGYLRRSASPQAALALTRMNSEIDVRRILPLIRVPTLVVHRSGDRLCSVEGGRFLAQEIPGARFVELPGIDHLPFVGNVDSLADAIQEFLTGKPPVVVSDRVLTTILVIDMIDSTGQAIGLGDERWRALLDSYRSTVRRELRRFQGVERNTSGDGFIATFDGPGRAIQCAQAIVANVRMLGVEIRTGLHTGECAISGDELDGIAVHIAARVITHAAAGEIVVTRTVRDLVAGANITLVSRGRRMLKGIPGMWQLYTVANGADQRGDIRS